MLRFSSLLISCLDQGVISLSIRNLQGSLLSSISLERLNQPLVRRTLLLMPLLRVVGSNSLFPSISFHLCWMSNYLTFKLTSSFFLNMELACGHLRIKLVLLITIGYFWGGLFARVSRANRLLIEGTILIISLTDYIPD